MCELETYYIGTDLKFKIEITASGFSMDDDDFSITLICGQEKVEYEKGDLFQDGNGDWYILIDTSQFKNGILKMVVTAEVPDEDFSGTDSLRTEMTMVNLCKLQYGQSYGLS